jgi:ABC-type nickel/cobalt efflux system permease component RcnA
MKKSGPYEFVAAVLAVLGALLLVAVYFPVLNPAQWSIDSQQEGAPLSRYLLGTTASMLVLSGAWYFNRKAAKLRREEQNAKLKQQPPA